MEWYKNDRSKLKTVLFLFNILFSTRFVTDATALLSSVGFYIVSLHNKDNVADLVMGIMFIILMLAAILDVETLSKEVFNVEKPQEIH